MAKTRGKVFQADHAVRERLLEAATELFARKGYAATTTREIVAAAKVTKPVLYYYFRNKEGIYLELMRQASRQLEAVADASILASGSSEEKLSHLCDRVLGLIVEQIEMVRLIYSIHYGAPQGAPFFDLDAVYKRLFDAVHQLVVEGIRKKELRKGDPEDMTWAILGAIHVTMENEISHPERGLGREGLRRILNFIFQGITAKRGNRGKGEKR